MIEENFTTSDESFQGHSVSMFDQRSGTWRQTWVDSAGNYLMFTGSLDGDVKEFRTQPDKRDGKTIVQRMVFSDITKTSLLWTWQGSEDDGHTWSDHWTITYRRR